MGFWLCKDIMHMLLCQCGQDYANCVPVKGVNTQKTKVAHLFTVLMPAFLTLVHNKTILCQNSSLNNLENFRCHETNQTKQTIVSHETHWPTKCALNFKIKYDKYIKLKKILYSWLQIQLRLICRSGIHHVRFRVIFRVNFWKIDCFICSKTLYNGVHLHLCMFCTKYKQTSCKYTFQIKI